MVAAFPGRRVLAAMMTAPLERIRRGWLAMVRGGGVVRGGVMVLPSIRA